MKRKKNAGMLITGIVIGLLMAGPGVQAATKYLEAIPTHQAIYVGGKQVNMTAYNIGGNNYIMLRDIGKEVGFNVFWDGRAVQVDSSSPYTGEAPNGGDQAQNDGQTQEGVDIEAIRQDMILRINTVRRENGVPELKVDDRLMAAAQECAGKKNTDHDSREECLTVAAHGYPYGFGNNLTVVYNTRVPILSERAVTSWVNSPGHLETMLDPSGDTIGVGAVIDGNCMYCHMFIGCPNTVNPYT